MIFPHVISNRVLKPAEPLEAIAGDVSSDGYIEPLCEIAPLQYEPVGILEEMSREDFERIKPREVVRYLKGRFVLFHKDSIYNNLISHYKGEHDKMGTVAFRNAIEKLAVRFRNCFEFYQK